MIISPKNPQKTSTINQINEREIPEIQFLDKDGNLLIEEFTVSDKDLFVSHKDDLRYGKVEKYRDRTLYYIKSFRGGRPGEYIPDPYSLLASPYDLSVVNDKRGERFCEYLNIRQDLFEAYQQYLKDRYPRVFKYVENQVKENNYI